MPTGLMLAGFDKTPRMSDSCSSCFSLARRRVRDWMKSPSKGAGERFMTPQMDLPRPAVEDFCRKWKIVRLELFGSVLREDFDPDSDVDFLCSFAADASWSLFDLMRMERELSEIVGRKADLVDREGVEGSRNWIRRREILSRAEPYYAT
jgi:predicted nucleotidyltransferase